MLVSKNCFSQENDKTESWAWARVHLFFENVTFFEGWRCSFEVKSGQDYERSPPLLQSGLVSTGMLFENVVQNASLVVLMGKICMS